MKKIFHLALLLFSPIVFAQETDVKKTIDTFFEGFHARDTIKMQSVLAKELVLHSVAEKPAGAVLSAETTAQFSKSIASIPTELKFEERLLSCTIQIEGSMAHAWTPYEFYINGKLSHSGVNSFQLFKDKTGWKIIYCIDTRRKP